MTLVHFQRLSLDMIPQPQRTIIRRRQNIPSIGRKLDMRNWRIRRIHKRLQTIIRTHIPYPNQSVVRTGRDERAIAVKMDGADGFTVGGQCCCAFPGFYVPDPDTFIHGAAGEEVG